MNSLALPQPLVGNKYFSIARVALRQRLGERSTLLARAAFYVLVLFIFSRIWRALDAGSGRYVWYLALTEWITLSQPRLFLEIERDVRSGDIAYRLTRPSSYLLTRLAEGAGELALGLVILGVVGLTSASFLAHGLPEQPAGLVLGAVLGVVAACVLLLCNALIGLSAFWVQDCSPLYWLWGKAVFVLGGLFVPLALYPSWLRLVALWLPFSALIGGPGSMVVEPDAKIFVLLLLRIGSCVVFALYALEVVYERALTRLEVNGG